ncbi:MAG: RusA family crossover junction endodeoxyribonuclease [Candidatus Obscuribacterales bacterium]|nr:RusA family crossover junction endodeoxyribonuclease [Candidatus Obscuribacterales bacterium]
MMIFLEVLGIARPGGSKTPGMTKAGRLFVRPANPKTAEWMDEVRKAAVKQYAGPLLSGPIEMHFDFRFPRPKKHFTKGGLLKPNAPEWHTNKPDLTKIIRSTEDALTNIVWKDDSLVCKRSEEKRYCSLTEFPGVLMVIREI